MFLHVKPSWRSRLRLAWKVLRGRPIWQEHVDWQVQQFSSNANPDVKVTWAPRK